MLRLFIVFALTISWLPAATAAESATASAPAAPVQVTCDHTDWNYTPGQPVKFTITVTHNGAPVADAKVTYSFGPEMLPAEKKTAVTSAAGTLVLDGGTMKEPGFLRCIATIEREGRTLRGLATAAFSPEKIKPTQAEPADFDAFWAKAKAELAALPIDARLTPMPEESNDKVEVFHVSLQNIGTPPGRSSRYYGVLCVPRSAGPFPAMMIPPGAGIRKFHGQKG